MSRPAESVLAEAEALVSAGVKELLVVSQDTSADGLVLPYLDIAFQHASRSVLKLMKRPAHSEKALQRISKWRSICPDLTIRSAFIVGFPGETDEDFQELLDFLDMAQIDRAGCFQYSDVEGATANAIEGQVPESLKQERFDVFMQHHLEISKNSLAAKVGQSVRVMIDAAEDEVALGRTEGDAPEVDAPEVDGVVEVTGCAEHVMPGEIISVEITESTEYDLIGKCVSETASGDIQ